MTPIAGRLSFRYRRGGERSCYHCDRHSRKVIDSTPKTCAGHWRLRRMSCVNVAFGVITPLVCHGANPAALTDN
jgi:hypothetical protein